MNLINNFMLFSYKHKDYVLNCKIKMTFKVFKHQHVEGLCNSLDIYNGSYLEKTLETYLTKYHELRLRVHKNN